MGERPKLKWGEAINEAGNRYGKLTIVRRVTNPGYTSYRCSFWLCRCDCGNEVVRPRQLLHSAGFKACPECVRREGENRRGLKIQPEWLLGKKFGSRTAIAQSVADPTKYLCRCECGREDYIAGSALLAGRQTHCASCARRLKPDKLIGLKFGMLTVLEKCDPRSITRIRPPATTAAGATVDKRLSSKGRSSRWASGTPAGVPSGTGRVRHHDREDGRF